MQELLEMVLNHVRLAWMHRWLALLIMAVICVSGGFYVLTLPDTYRVSAKIHVDTGSLLRPAIEGLALDTNASAQAVALMRRILLMRPNLAEIARATDLDLRARTPRQLDGLLSGLQRGIKLSQTRRGGIFTIAYTNQNPQLAKQVVDAVINLFLERSLGEARRSTVATQEFIEQQLKVYERKLIEAERRLIEFKGKKYGPDARLRIHFLVPACGACKIAAGRPTKTQRGKKPPQGFAESDGEFGRSGLVESLHRPIGRTVQ